MLQELTEYKMIRIWVKKMMILKIYLII